MPGIIKPEPLHLGDRYYYTLTSYDPVTIEIRVPRVTQADIDLAVLAMINEHESDKAPEDRVKLADLTDEWVAEAYPDMGTIATLRETLHRQLEQMNAQIAEESKGQLCAAQLAKRLGQSVPADEVARVRASIQQSMAMDLAREGMTIADFMRQTGLPELSLENMLDEQAQAAAEQDAALDAFAQEKKLKVDDAELPQFLGAPLAEAQKVIEDARSHGQLEYLRQVATRMKAMRVAVAECSASYVQETPEEAEARLAEVRTLIENPPTRSEASVVEGGKDEAPAVPDAPADDPKSNFKLV